MPELELDLNPSKQFIMLFMLAMVACLIIIANLSILLSIKIFLWLFVLSYGGHALLLSGFLKMKKSIRKIRLIGDICEFSDQLHSYPVKLLGDSVVSRFCCILRYKTPDYFLAQSCVIFRDSLKQDDYRKLLVYLKCH